MFRVANEYSLPICIFPFILTHLPLSPTYYCPFASSTHWHTLSDLGRVNICLHPNQNEVKGRHVRSEEREQKANLNILGSWSQGEKQEFRHTVSESRRGPVSESDTGPLGGSKEEAQGERLCFVTQAAYQCLTCLSSSYLLGIQDMPGTYHDLSFTE